MEPFLRRHAIERTLQIMEHDENGQFPTEREEANILLLSYSSLQDREQTVFYGLIKELQNYEMYSSVEVGMVQHPDSLIGDPFDDEDIPDEFRPNQKERQRLRSSMIDELVRLKLAKVENGSVFPLLHGQRLQRLDNLFLALRHMEQQCYKELCEGEEKPERYIDYNDMTGELKEVQSREVLKPDMPTLGISSVTKKFMDYMWTHQRQELSKRLIAKEIGVDFKALYPPTYIGDMGFNVGDREGRYFVKKRRGYVWFQAEYEQG